MTKWLLVCAVIVTIGFRYISQTNAIQKLGDDIRQHEQRLDALRKRHVVLTDQVAGLKAPRVIDAKCRMWNLGLGVPRQSQIVRVPDPMHLPKAVPAQVASRTQDVRDN